MAVIGLVCIQYAFEMSVSPLHIAIPALGGTFILAIFLAVLWLALFWLVSGKAPISDSSQSKIRINLATLRGITGFSWFIEPIFSRLDEIERARSLKQQKSEASEIIQDFIEIVDQELKISVDAADPVRNSLQSTIVSETEQLKVDSYPIISNSILSDHEESSRQAIEALVLAWEIERLRQNGERKDFTGEQAADFTQGVRNAIDIFNFHDPGEPERMFLSLYDRYRASIQEQTSFSDTDDGDLDTTLSLYSTGLTNEDLSSLYREFMHRYYPSQSWPYYAENEYVEYKNKIVELVNSQISVGGVQSDIFSILSEERARIREQLEAQEAYLICSKEISEYDDSFQYEILKDKYDRSIRIGRKYLEVAHRESSEELEIKIRIVFPHRSYGSADNFINQSLADVIPTGELVYVSKLSMPFTQHRDESELFAIADEEEDVDYVLSKTDILLRGRSESDITRAAIDNLRMSEMDVSELLTSLSLRSVVPKATYEEEEFFSARREDIEDGLGINDIFEWGERDPNVIGDLLDRWDEDDVSSRWKDIMNEYIDEISTATPPDHIDPDEISISHSPS